MERYNIELYTTNTLFSTTEHYIGSKVKREVNFE